MYGFDQSTQTGGSSRLPAGINENVFLQDILFEPLKADGDGDTVMKFLFADANGDTFNHIEWPLDYDRLVNMAKGWGKQGAEAEVFAKNEFRAQGERVQHILSCFIPKDKCVFKADTFEAFVEGCIKLLGDNHKNVPCRMKIVYKKGSSYTTFPKRAIKPFIQAMSEPNKLKIDPKWDIIEAPEPDNDDQFSVKPASNGAKEEEAPLGW